MTTECVLRLTPGELEMLRTIIGYVEDGDVSIGPPEGLKHQQTTANYRMFRALAKKANQQYEICVKS